MNFTCDTFFDETKALAMKVKSIIQQMGLL